MSPTYSALDAVSAGIYTALNIAAVTALAPGGVTDDLPQGVSFPAVLYEVSERPRGGFGTKPGVGQLPEITLRVHVFTQGDGFQAADAVMNQVLKALADPPTVTGYASHAIFHDGTVPLPAQDVNGLRVNELVATFRLYVELT